MQWIVCTRCDCQHGPKGTRLAVYETEQDALDAAWSMDPTGTLLAIYWE